MTRTRFILTGREACGHRRRYVFEVFTNSSCPAGPSVTRALRTERIEDSPARRCILEAVTRRRLKSPDRYSARGPQRGPCNHRHRHIDDAVECLDADDAACIAEGGRTDRRIFAVGPAGWRELNADELAAVELYRAGIGKQSKP